MALILYAWASKLMINTFVIYRTRARLIRVTSIHRQDRKHFITSAEGLRKSLATVNPDINTSHVKANLTSKIKLLPVCQIEF